MKFLLNTTLALGLALAGSVAYAQTNPDQDQLDSEFIEEEHEGEATPRLSPEEEQRADEFDQPEMQRVPSQDERQSVEPVEPDSEMDVEEEELNEPVEEKGAYGSYMTPREEESEDPGVGFNITAGGGIFNFSDSDARDVTDLGASYTARVGLNTKSFIGVEVAYIGTAQGTEALGLDNDANLISNGIEGVARVNFLKGAFKPYVLGGAAWKRYDIVNEDFNTSALQDQDDVVEFPVGIGIGYQYKKLLLDARGDYRFATDDELIGGEDGASLSNWNVSVKAGVQF